MMDIDQIRQAGDSIGPYRILDVISSGGMGTVYRAVRSDREYRQTVALKLIKRGMDTELIVRRFRNERQILATLQHPNIAALLDGGTAPDGRPYLVMEYVEGKPITAFADEHCLTIDARLELFRTVCSAVEYAHQNLVVHRDLKPNNIFVTAEGIPKLLDFGIAKLLAQDEPVGEPSTTASTIRLLTPEFASPEQVRGDAIATSSDVYSLGVLLYTLLTGRWPYRLKSRRRDDVIDAICAQAPERPSVATARIESSDATPEQIAAARSTDVDKLRRTLRGDLDTVLLMALRKEPSRRYASVAQLSEDIQRYVEGRPVRAHRDTFAYRSGKFLRRHTKAAVGAALVFLSLLGGVIATAWEAHAARRERALAERRFNDVRSLANSLVFDGYEAVQSIPGTHAARQLMIKRAIEYLDNLAEEATDDRQLQSDLATAYDKIRTLTNTATELELHRKALAINQNLVKADPSNRKYREQLSASYALMGDLLRETGDSAGALANYQNSLKMMESLAGQFPDDRAGLADAIELMGFMLDQVGQLHRPVEYQRRAFAIRKEILDAAPDSVEARQAVAVSHHYLALLEGYEGEFTQAFGDQRQALSVVETLIKQDPRNAVYRRDLWAMHRRLGNLYALSGEPKTAVGEYNAGLTYLEALSAADPGDSGHRRGIAVTYLDIGDALYDMHEDTQALAAYRHAMAVSEALYAIDPAKVETTADLATMYAHFGRALLRRHELRAAAEALGNSRDLFDRMWRRDPMNAEVIRGRAELDEASGDLALEVAAADPRLRRQKWVEARDEYNDALDELARFGADRRRSDVKQIEEVRRRLSQIGSAAAAPRSALSHP